MERYLGDKDRREAFLGKIRKVVEADVLSDEEALTIIQICKDALKRREAEITEEYLMSVMSQERAEEE